MSPLVPIEHRLNATAYLSIVADHVHPFVTIVYPSSDATSRNVEEGFQHLVEYMPWRIKAVLKAKVGPTRY